MTTEKKPNPSAGAGRGDGIDVRVYRSERRADTYLFLACKDSFEGLPDALREHFGTAAAFLEFNLHADRYLEQADPRQVLASIHEKGFYLQLPPSKEHPADD